MEPLRQDVAGQVGRSLRDTKHCLVLSKTGCYGEQSKGNIEDVEQTPELPPAHGGQRVVVDVPVLSPGHCHVQGQYRAVQSAEVQLQGRVLGQLSHLKVVEIACNCLREGNTKHVEQSEQK